MNRGTLIAGRYRLDDRLASGGMGEVWRGTDTRLNRTVAIKTLHAAYSGDDTFRMRFQHEAQSVAALRSPGIVALYDYGEEETEQGAVPYLVMELVEGKSLSDLLKERGRLPYDEALSILATAAEALAVAHEKHIIHRDIKPANLLVSDRGEAKLVDFGIASARGQASLTETGTVLGTLLYASPEQLQAAELTGLTDLYSLGIVAYQCLAGSVPFRGNDPVALITAHLNGNPAPLPQDVPPAVAQIVMRCMERDPNRRFSSADELAQACKAAMAAPTQPLYAAPPQGAPTVQQGMAQPGIAQPGPNSTRLMPAQAPASGQHQAGPPDSGQYRAGPPANGMPPHNTGPQQPYDTGSRPAPPQRRKGRGALIGVLSAMAALVIAAVLILQLGGEDDPGDVQQAGDDTSSENAAPPRDDESSQGQANDQSDAPSGNGDEAGDEESTRPEDEEEQAPEESTDEESEAPEYPAMPDVFSLSMPAAESKLYAEGVDDFTMEPVADANGEPCTVFEQYPSAGTPVEPDVPAGFKYVEDPEDPNCDNFR
ncbi:serine/threonine-protein kinase [Salininema proteolyticum]|uniref:non-specific serine/threonine protein kinase n=1 Tax=Salininema proteolyticum TaxID=1607685 RepID=A0ABV8TV71_9ACTN